MRWMTTSGLSPRARRAWRKPNRARIEALWLLGHRALALSVSRQNAGAFRGVFVYREVAERVDGVAFLAPWTMNSSESLRLANPGKRRTRVESVAARSPRIDCQVVKERLRLILAESAHFPHALGACRERYRGRVWRWDFVKFESLRWIRRPFHVEVEIDRADIFYVCLVRL